MKTSTEVLEGNRAKITVTVDAKTISARVKKQYKSFANQYNFPGFRRGKAPRPLIDSALGKEAVPAMVADEIVNETAPQALDESGIFPIGKPDFGEDEIPLVVDGKEYVYAFEIETKPEFELSSYEPVKIELPEEGCTEAEIDAEVEAMREHYFRIVDAKDSAPIEEKGYADLAMRATDDAGELIESITTDSRQYELGSGLLPETFDTELLGLKKGDKKTFAIDMPLEPTVMTGSLMGKTSQIHFEIEVLGVKEKALPDVTDEWVKETLGLDDIKALRTDIADAIEAQKSSGLPRLKEARCLQALTKRLSDEVPEAMIDDAEASLMQDFFRQLQTQGMTLDAYLKQMGINQGQFREDVKAQAGEEVKQDLALDAWARHAKLTVNDQDIEDEFEKTGVDDPHALKEEWSKNGQMYLIRQGILRQKAAAEVIDSAQITRVDLEGNQVEQTADEQTPRASEADETPEKKDKAEKKDKPAKKDKAAKKDTPAKKDKPAKKGKSKADTESLKEDANKAAEVESASGENA